MYFLRVGICGQKVVVCLAQVEIMRQTRFAACLSIAFPFSGMESKFQSG